VTNEPSLHQLSVLLLFFNLENSTIGSGQMFTGGKLVYDSNNQFNAKPITHEFLKNSFTLPDILEGFIDI
jgi:hypothetical protein